MPFTINDLEVERLARELAEATGEPLPAAVAAALRDRLQRARSARAGRRVPEADAWPEPVAEASRFGSVEEIQAYVAALPVLDPRAPEEIVGYDEQGLPT